jgi:hypothetical protein
MAQATDCFLFTLYCIAHDICILFLSITARESQNEKKKQNKTKKKKKKKIKKRITLVWTIRGKMYDLRKG